MKKGTMLIIAATLMLQSQIIAQVTESYIPDNLGRIAEVANSGGTLTTPHLLIGYDTTGIMYQSNSLNAFRIFANAPSTTTLQSLNSQNRFGAPGTHDCYEVRFGSDSSRYWINTSAVGTGGNLAPNQLPFSVYYVGPKSSVDTSITGGIKLCLKVTDQDANSIFTAGERITVFADLALPLDSTYDSLSYRVSNPFVTSHSVITYLRFGAASVPNSQTTFSVPGDGFIPPSGTVIRFVAKTGDAIAPIVYNLTDTFRTSGPGIFTTTFSVYSYEEPVYSLIDAPPGMTVSNGIITWEVTEDQIGQVYNVILQASNGAGVSTRVFRAKGSWGIQEIKTEGAGNLMRMWQRNDGSIAYHASQGNFGLEYLINSGYSLNYAGGLYIGGLKRGVTGIPDTFKISNCEYNSEFQPGRIINSGPFGTLIAENFLTNPTLFQLPFHVNSWPAEAPHKSNGDPLKLSVIDTWTVFNDLDISKATPDGQNINEFSPGLGVEIQRMTFQFDQYPFNNAVVMRYIFINKSDVTYDSCYIGFWDDPDIGFGGYDLAVGDSALSVIVSYNIINDWDYYPIAYGSLLLQGPLTDGSSGDTAIIMNIGTDGFEVTVIPDKKTLNAGSFLHYPNPNGEPSRLYGDKTRYWYISGLDAFGNQKVGGPFDIGYVYAGNRKGTIGTGPFTFSPGDSQIVWYAMVGGYDPIDSSAKDTVLYYAQLMRSIFYNNMNDFLVDVKDLPGKPQEFVLFPNYPNPFNPSTTIRYELRQSSKVSLKVYNILGQEVKTLVNKHQSNGIHSVVWDGKNERGQRVTSGVYFYRLQAGDFVKTRKMVLVK